MPELNYLKVITPVLKKQLAPARVLDVRVDEGFDADGDPILRIQVVYEAEQDRLDPHKVVSLIRHLRGPLNKEGSEHFPVLSFMTEEEAHAAT